MIEFPRKTRLNDEQETSQASLPAWRVELNEKVRAIRAKRDVSGAAPDASVERLANEPESDLIDDGSGIGRNGANAKARAAISPPISNPRPTPSRLDIDAAASLPTRSTNRGNNTIVEAALTRVRRASENASRAALPKIEPARPLSTMAVDKEATARALEPMIEPAPKTSPGIPPVAGVTEEFEPIVAKSEPAITRPYLDRPENSASAIESFKASADEPRLVKLIASDDIEPVDYLQAEIRKVDEALSSEFLRNESPPLYTHVVLGIVDLLAIALSAAPFVALAQIVNGNLTQSKWAMASIISLVAFFYLAITQCLCGKTFGMMLTNTRVVDAYTFESVSPQRMLVRSAGYFIALAPAMLGFIWALFNRKHRGSHDIVSGTLIARDF